METANEKYQVKQLCELDILLFQKLILMFEEVFKMENTTSAKAHYLISLLDKPEFIAFAIIHDDEVVGGLTAYELQLYYNEYSEVYLYDIAIRPEFQRMGLGTMLISALNDYCEQNQIQEFFVEVNEEDHDAVDFYRSTGGKTEKVVHFNFPVVINYGKGSRKKPGSIIQSDLAASNDQFKN